MVQPASRLGAEQENEPNEWMERQGAGDDRNSGRNPHCPDRADQTPGPALPIWVVHIGDNLYVRSYRGPRAAGIAAAGAMAVDGSAQRTCHGRLAFKRCSDIRRAPRRKYDRQARLWSRVGHSDHHNRYRLRRTTP